MLDEIQNGFAISPIGIIPKARQPGKWRLIVDLSSPRGASINEAISADRCSLHYTKVDHVARAVLVLGRGTLLSKLDLKSAYRVVPVRPQDRPLLGIRWNGQIFVDGALPFGLRSAPKIFNTCIGGCLVVDYVP